MKRPAHRQPTLQDAFAKKVGVEMASTPNLIPGGRHSSFWVPDLPASSQGVSMICTERLCDLAMAAVARRIDEYNAHWHVIDHQWSLLYADKPHEPWGFVLEPYLDFDKAHALAVAVTHEMGDPWRHSGARLSAQRIDMESWPLPADRRPDH